MKPGLQLAGFCYCKTKQNKSHMKYLDLPFWYVRQTIERLFQLFIYRIQMKGGEKKTPPGSRLNKITTPVWEAAAQQLETNQK